MDRSLSMPICQMREDYKMIAELPVSGIRKAKGAIAQTKSFLMSLSFNFVFKSSRTESTLVLFLHHVHPEIERWVSRQNARGCREGGRSRRTLLPPRFQISLASSGSTRICTHCQCETHHLSSCRWQHIGQTCRRPDKQICYLLDSEDVES